jgi:hypothetical protein
VLLVGERIPRSWEMFDRIDKRCGSRGVFAVECGCAGRERRSEERRAKRGERRAVWRRATVGGRRVVSKGEMGGWGVE